MFEGTAKHCYQCKLKTTERKPNSVQECCQIKLKPNKWWRAVVGGGSVGSTLVLIDGQPQGDPLVTGTGQPYIGPALIPSSFISAKFLVWLKCGLCGQDGSCRSRGFTSDPWPRRGCAGITCPDCSVGAVHSTCMRGGKEHYSQVCLEWLCGARPLPNICPGLSQSLWTLWLPQIAGCARISLGPQVSPCFNDHLWDRHPAYCIIWGTCMDATQPRKTDVEWAWSSTAYWMPLIFHNYMC